MAAVTLVVPGPSNLPQVAGYCSQLAGVLAGFSFAGLVALVTIRRRVDEQTVSIWHSVLLLTSAFVALVASSLDYALVTGELAGTRRVASLQTIAGMGFSVAGIMLVYSILVLLSDLRQNAGAPAIDLLRNLTVLILPPLLVLLMWAGVRDHLIQKHGEYAGFIASDWIVLGALAVTVVASVTFRVTADRYPNDQIRHLTRVAKVGALLAFLSLIGSAGLIAMTSADAEIPDAIPVSATLLVAGFCTATAYSASRYRSSSDRQQEATARRRTGNAEASVSEANGVGVRAQRRGGALEPLDRPTLIRRSVETFPQAYLMNISIIQGVALSVMTVETVNFIKTAGPDLRLPSLAQSVFSLAALIIVSYEYLWFTTVMRWTPTFRDTALPVVLGVGEIIPPLLLGYTTAWWIATAAFAMLGGVAFFNTVSRLRVEMFPNHVASYRAIRRLLLRLATICVCISGAAVTVALLVDPHRDHAAAISTVAPCVIILVGAVTIIGYSEAVLNRVYADYEISRRPPMFDRLRTALRREQARPTAAVPVIHQGGPLTGGSDPLPNDNGQPAEDATR